MQALRHSELRGVVNTELKDQLSGRGVQAGELLKPAIMSYVGVPLLLRRPAVAQIADFALDLLLGKACLIVTHSDGYARGLQPLTSLVHALSDLAPDLCWANLQSVVSRSISVRKNPDRSTDLRLYSPVTELDSLDLPRELSVSKVEPLLDKYFQVMVDGEPRPYTARGHEVTFRLEVAPKRSVTIEMRMSAMETAPSAARSPFKLRARVAARRYLSEIRDNQIAKSAWATKAVASARNLMHKILPL